MAQGHREWPHSFLAFFSAALGSKRELGLVGWFFSRSPHGCPSPGVTCGQRPEQKMEKFCIPFFSNKWGICPKDPRRPVPTSLVLVSRGQETTGQGNGPTLRVPIG